MKTTTQFIAYTFTWLCVGWLLGCSGDQIYKQIISMKHLNYIISESYLIYPILGLFVVVIILIFSQFKIINRMEAIEKLTTKIADENVTVEEATALVKEEVASQVAAEYQGILDLIKNNSTEDGLTRDQVNEITKKLNETLEKIGSDAPAVEEPTPTDPVTEA